MKAIQFKKTDCPVSGINDKEIMKEFGGFFEFKGLGRGNRITTFKTANGQEKVIRLGDWVREIDGAIVVLSNEEYQLLQSKKSKDSSRIISNAVKAVIKKEGHQGGLLAGSKAITVDYIKPPYVIELEDQIKAITDTVSALACRIEVLSGEK